MSVYTELFYFISWNGVEGILVTGGATAVQGQTMIFLSFSLF